MCVCVPMCALDRRVSHTPYDRVCVCVCVSVCLCGVCQLCVYVHVCMNVLCVCTCVHVCVHVCVYVPHVCAVKDCFLTKRNPLRYEQIINLAISVYGCSGMYPIVAE